MRKPVDSKYRDMIVQDLNGSMLVEAGAGSGKTTSLIGRMLATIGSGECTVDKMAAVTFTRKAASELKGRFQLELEKALRRERDSKKRERYQKALLNLEMLFAGTIHSFCARILRERPIEAGLDPDFQELEEEENAILRDRCWSEYLEALQLEQATVLKEIAELGIDPAGLASTYENLALYPEVEVIRKKRKRPDFEKERKLFQEYVGRVWDAMPTSVPQKGWDDLQNAIRRIRLRMRYIDIRKDTDFIQLLGMLDKKIRVTQDRWQTKEIGKAEQATFDQFKKSMISPCLVRWRQYCHFFIMELIIPAVERFRLERQKGSFMNFHDLLTRTASLLRDNPEVRGYFQERFTHILVDEFQDTDPLQAEVILYLTSKDLRERSWQNARVKPGALFIVGDPKQSIYRFRRADIDTYNEVKRIIRDSGGKVIPLTANFRSLPSLCAWVNPIFEAKFPKEESRVQPAFEPMNPYKTEKGGGVKRITIPKVKGNSAWVIAAQDAERIASVIDQSLKGKIDLLGATGESGPLSAGDFMILLRYKKHLSVYARAMEASSIPYQITGGGAFNNSEELAQLMNLLQAVAVPEDQVALIATLRGAHFGVSDDLLFRFKRAGGVFSCFGSQERCKDEEARGRMEEALSTIREMHGWSRTLPPAGALSRILDRLGIIPLAMTGDMAESRAGNILKTLEIGFFESGRSLTSFPEMVERLAEYFTEIEVEEMSVEPAKEDAVRIMNLHKAKGLEAKVVFLADPYEVSHEPDLHIRRIGEKAVGYFAASHQEGERGAKVVGIPPDWDEFMAAESEYRNAEEERLLYVAVTRAKGLLIVSRYPEKPDFGAWKDLYPHLEGVEELPFAALKPRGKKGGVIKTKVFEAARAERMKRLGKAKEKSYEAEAVTKVVEAKAGEMVFSGDRGMSWGRIIHRMLEAAAKDARVDLELMAENLLKEEEWPLSEKESVIRSVKAVMGSDLWQRMEKAEKALVEVPFSLSIEGTRLPRIVSGVIDLAFKEPDGWVIADYKTDKVDGNMEKLVAYYRPQVEMYRRFWTELSGEKVKEAGLYLVDGGIWVRI